MNPTKRIRKILSVILAAAVAMSLLCIPSFAAGYYVTCPPDGDYVLSPASHSGFALDVAGGGDAPAGTFLHLWEKNGSDAQIFHIQHVDGDWYVVTHKRTGLCMNVQNGVDANDSRLWLWNVDGTPACYVRFFDCENGRVIIQSQLGSQRILDLDNDLGFNGSIVHLWDLHYGNSAQWVLTPVSSPSAPSVSFPAISASQYISTYALASSGRIYAYSSANLSAATGGWIDAAPDLCRIIGISGNAVQISYPVSGGRRIAWFPLNQFMTSETVTGCKTATGGFTVYRRDSGSGTIGSVYQNDTVYILGSRGGRTQLIYPVSGGLWKMGYANAADVQKFLGEGNAANNPVPAPSEGNYAAYNGVNYRNLTSDSRRIAACDKAVQMSTVLWTAPCSFPTWKSSGGSYNTVTATDGSSGTTFQAGKTYQGIPYSMAGRTYDDIKWVQLLSNGISTGSMTGKHYTSRADTTACGIDCSYLVSVALNTGCGTSINMTTADMLASSKFTKIKRSDMLPGDIFLKKGHVMFFMGKTSNGEYAVIEANASYSRVVYRELTTNQVSSYNSYRYTAFS